MCCGIIKKNWPMAVLLSPPVPAIHCLCQLLYKYAIMYTPDAAQCVLLGCPSSWTRPTGFSAIALSPLMFVSQKELRFYNNFMPKGHCGVATFDSNDCNYYDPNKKKSSTG